MKIQFLLLPAVLSCRDYGGVGSWDMTPPSVKSALWAHTKLDSTSQLLYKKGLDDVWLKYNVDLSPKTRHAIRWTQSNRCRSICLENYWEFYYYEEHDAMQLPVKVFVADEYVTNGAPPTWIHTQNAHQRLYMTYFPIDYAKPEEDHAFVFVYQPPENEDDREIYQKRFHMGLNDLVEKAVGALGATAGTYAGATAGATVGAAVGSIVPVAGTAIGGAIGAAMGAAGGFVGGYGATHFTNNYTGDFLRYVG